MKNISLISMAFLMAFALWACKDKQDTVAPDNPAQTNQAPTNQPPPNATGQPGRVNTPPANIQGQSEIVRLQHSVLSFRAENGRFPKTLEELQTTHSIGADISKYNFDSTTGHVSIKK